MAQNKNHLGLNVDSTDADRILVLRHKRLITGLEESEKEELKQLEEKGRLAK